MGRLYHVVPHDGLLDSQQVRVIQVVPGPQAEPSEAVALVSGDRHPVEDDLLVELPLDVLVGRPLHYIKGKELSVTLNIKQSK